MNREVDDDGQSDCLTVGVRAGRYGITAAHAQVHEITPYQGGLEVVYSGVTVAADGLYGTASEYGAGPGNYGIVYKIDRTGPPPRLFFEGLMPGSRLRQHRVTVNEIRIRNSHAVKLLARSFGVHNTAYRCEDGAHGGRCWPLL